MTATVTSSKGVCIVNSEHEAKLDPAEIGRAGYKLRSSPTCLPDVLVTGGGAATAFLALDSGQGAQQLVVSGVWSRIDRVHNKGFPRAFVVVTNWNFDRSFGELHHKILQASCRFKGNPSFVHAAPSQTLTQAALAIAGALDGEKFGSLNNQKDDGVTSLEADMAALIGLPDLNIGEQEAGMLAQLGSLSHIAQANMQDIILHTLIKEDRATEIIDYFRMTG